MSFQPIRKITLLYLLSQFMANAKTYGSKALMGKLKQFPSLNE